MRGMHQPTAGEERQRPVQSGFQHAHRVRFEHMMHAKIAPYPLDGVHGSPEMRRVRGESDRTDRAGGGSGNDGKRASRAAPQQSRDAFEHAHLIGRARATACQYQAELRCLESHVASMPLQRSPFVTLVMITHQSHHPAPPASTGTSALPIDPASSRSTPFAANAMAAEG